MTLVSEAKEFNEWLGIWAGGERGGEGDGPLTSC